MTKILEINETCTVNGYILNLLNALDNTALLLIRHQSDQTGALFSFINSIDRAGLNFTVVNDTVKITA